jgi:hypothetical protein
VRKKRGEREKKELFWKEKEKKKKLGFFFIFLFFFFNIYITYESSKIWVPQAIA